MLEGLIEPLPQTASNIPQPLTDFDKGSPQSFEELFLAIYPRLVSILRRMLGDCGRAEELANEAFLKLHTAVLPPAAKKNLPGWLYRTAMNLGIDDLRARSRHFRLVQQASPTPSTSPDDGLQHVLRTERQKRVRAVLARLKPELEETAAGFRQRLQEGGINPQELVVTRVLSQELSDYRVETPTALAMRQLQQAGIMVRPGEKVRFVHRERRGPKELRVQAAPFLEGLEGYDTNTYLELLERAVVEVMAGVFGEEDRERQGRLTASKTGPTGGRSNLWRPRRKGG